MPVVAFDLRICLGACIVCLELLAKYLIRGPVSRGLAEDVESGRVCSPPSPRLRLFFLVFFSFLFFHIFCNNLLSRRGKKASGVSREQQPHPTGGETEERNMNQ